MRYLVVAAVAAIACFSTMNVASADQIFGAEFVLDIASGPNNTNALNVGLTTVLGGADNATVGVGGVLLADIDFDSTSGKVNTFRVRDGNITTYGPLTLNLATLFGALNANVTQLSGVVVSDVSPTQYPVDGSNQFDATKHKITVNSGQANVSGLATATVDFAATNINASGTGNGTFTTTPNGDGFDGVITIPFSATTLVADDLATVTVNGNLVASGTFSSSSVPEPTGSLFLTGLVIAAAARRRRRV